MASPEMNPAGQPLTAPMDAMGGAYIPQPAGYPADGSNGGVIPPVTYPAGYTVPPVSGSSVATPAAPAATSAPPAPPLTPEEYNQFLVTPTSPWPPPIFVKRNVSAEERFYLDNRWYSQWKFFDKKANDNKKNYHRLQLIIGVGSVVVPVMVGINATDPVVRDILYVLTVGISLLVAACAAIENIYKYSENWRSYRQAAEELQQEKSLYDVRAGRYAGNPDPFIRFAERTEEIIAKQNGQFMQTVEKQQTQAEQQTTPMLDKYRTEGQNLLTSFGSEGTYSTTGGAFYSGTTPTAASVPVDNTGSAG